MPRSGRPRPERPRNGLDQNLAQAVEAHRAGDLGTASRLYRRLLKAQPGHADTLHLSGLVAFQQGHPDKAIGLIEQAVRRDPGRPDYQANLGRVLQAAGHPEDAAECFRRVLELVPDSAVALSDLAAALIAAGSFEAVPELCRRALDHDPHLAAAQVNLGIALLHGGDAAAAERALAAALALIPNDPFALFQMGRVHQASGKPDDAESCYRRTLDLAPGMAEAHSNLGNILKDAGDFEAAAAEYEAALALDSTLSAAYCNLGVVRQEQGDPKAALACFDRALERDPDDAESHRNRAMVLLLTGRLAEGWREYEWRWKTAHFAPIRRRFPMPLWDGGDLAGRRILVHAEQGFGDTLQFCRYLPLLVECGAEVTFECPRELSQLVASVDPAIKVIAAGDPLPVVDFHVALLSLPERFGTDLETVPASPPYLFPEPDRVRAWAERLGGGEELRVGVAWRGSVRFKRDRIRSPGLSVLRPLFDRKGVRFVSLQKDQGAADLSEADLSTVVADIASGWTDFADSAAALACLDLIITPDTAVAHLAGALGRPVWVLLPHVAEWRWLEEREDSPWYPTARLFRQPRRGDWDEPVARMAAALEKEGFGVP